MTEAKITITVECPGYRSTIELPITPPCQSEAFAEWFKMQLDYLARWTPGATAEIHETRPPAPSFQAPPEAGSPIDLERRRRP